MQISTQWGTYDGFDVQLQRALSRTRRMTGRFVPRTAVIPPGLDFSRVKPIDFNAPPPEGDEEPPIWREIAKFLRNPRKPAILALARPDPKKNLVRFCCRATRCSSLTTRIAANARTSVRRARHFARAVQPGARYGQPGQVRRLAVWRSFEIALTHVLWRPSQASMRWRQRRAGR